LPDAGSSISSETDPLPSSSDFIRYVQQDNENSLNKALTIDITSSGLLW